MSGSFRLAGDTDAVFREAALFAARCQSRTVRGEHVLYGLSAHPVIRDIFEAHGISSTAIETVVAAWPQPFRRVWVDHHGMVFHWELGQFMRLVSGWYSTRAVGVAGLACQLVQVQPNRVADVLTACHVNRDALHGVLAAIADGSPVPVPTGSTSLAWH